MSEGRKARDLELLDALDKFARTPIAADVWRVVRDGRDVLQASAVAARWDPGSFPVLYTSFERDGALEEVYFHLSRQPVFPSVPFDLYRLEARGRAILRLDDLSQLASLGVERDRLAQLDYSRTQAIADGAFFLGFDGLIVPSARSPCLNLILFAERLEAGDLAVKHSERVDWREWRRKR